MTTERGEFDPRAFKRERRPQRKRERATRRARARLSRRCFWSWPWGHVRGEPYALGYRCAACDHYVIEDTP